MNRPKKSKGRSPASAGEAVNLPGRNHRVTVLRVVLLTLVAWSAAPPVGAIPAFTRQYDVPCHFCHDGYPRLSPIGQRFRDRGFRLEDETNTVNEWLKSVPVSLRAGVNEAFVEDGDATTEGFIDVISAGSIGSRVAYWFDYNWAVDGDGFRRVGTDNAWLRVDVLPEDLYVRGGRMELDLPFSQTRTPNLFGYDIYLANTGFEVDNIGEHHDGVEVGGFIDDETHWSVSVVDARGVEEFAGESDGFDPAAFGRFAQYFGENRVGLFAYLASNTLALAIPNQVLLWENDLLRLGLDGSFYFDRWNLYGVFMHGRNTNSIADAANPDGTGETLGFTGGFLQVNYFVRDFLNLSTRIDLVNRPPGRTALPNETFVGVFPGVMVWIHSNFKLTLELGFQNRGRPNLVGLQAELAF